jgi:cytochrome P450
VSNGFNPDTFNPHDPGFLADPCPTYALFRAQAPIHRVEQFKSSWLFTYDDCKQVLDDKEVWVKNSPLPPGPEDQPHGPYGATSSLPPGLFSSDPKPHTKLRAILEPLFDTAIEAAPGIAAEIAEPLLADAQEHGRIELMSGYALLLPARVLFRLLGIPDDPGVWDGLIAWQSAIVAAHDIAQSAAVRGGGATCSMALNTYFEALRVSYRTAPGNGLFAEMCQAFRSKRLTPEQVQACAHDFLVAGYISTTFLIGNGTRNLLRFPEQLAALLKDLTLMDSAIKEMLRFDAPAQLVDRCAAVDTELGGRPFKAGDRVTAVLGSANHDANAFDNPDEFLITRNPSAHLSFGDGIHRCIGAPLVECVAPVAFDLLLSAFPDLSMDGTPQWQTDPYLRAVSSLPLKL